MIKRTFSHNLLAIQKQNSSPVYLLPILSFLDQIQCELLNQTHSTEIYHIPHKKKQLCNACKLYCE